MTAMKSKPVREVALGSAEEEKAVEAVPQAAAMKVLAFRP
jgi:hypothetical protein